MSHTQTFFAAAAATQFHVRDFINLFNDSSTSLIKSKQAAGISFICLWKYFWKTVNLIKISVQTSVSYSEQIRSLITSQVVVLLWKVCYIFTAGKVQNKVCMRICNQFCWTFKQLQFRFDFLLKLHNFWSLSIETRNQFACVVHIMEFICKIYKSPRLIY